MSYEWIPKVSALIKECHQERRIFQTLIGIRASPSRKAQLFHFNDTGAPREINDYYVIGKGEPLGRFFLKIMLKKDMTMKQVAILGTFIIRCIEKLALDDSVGIGEHFPTIWWVPNLIEPYTIDEQLPDDLKLQYSVRDEKDRNILNDIQQSAEEMLDAIQSFVGSLITQKVIEENKND